MTAQDDQRCTRCGTRTSRYNNSSTCGPCSRSAQQVDASSIPEQVWQHPEVAGALRAWDFAIALQRIRELSGLRQTEMATLTGLSQSHLSLVETGERRLVNIEKIARMLSGMGVPPEISPIVLPGTVSPLSPHPIPQPWESPLEIAQRLAVATGSNVEPATLNLLEQTVTDLVARYETEGPYRLAPETVGLRGFVQDQLDGRQPPRQREKLFRLAAQASGLLAYMAVNAGHETLAEAYCAEALALAGHIEDRPLMMWLHGTRSLAAYYAGDFPRAAQAAEHGIGLGPDDPQAIRLLSNGLARARAKLGDTTGALRAIGEAEELTARHRVPDGLTSCIAFEPYSAARTLANAATAHLALGHAREVLCYATQIDTLVNGSDSAWSRALVRLDVATALLAGSRPDVEQAMVLGRQVLSNGSGAPIRSVVQRAGELQEHASPWKDMAIVRDYTDALRAWRSTPAVGALTASGTMTAPRTQREGAGSAARARSESVPADSAAQHH